jgi:spermidine/putrescine transport system substrate-binding protein
MRKILSISLLLGVFYQASCKKVENTESNNDPNNLNSVKLLSWSEYFDPDALDQFTKDTGIEVEYIIYDDPDEVEARLASEPGKFDVVIADDLSINRLSELRLIQQIDTDLVPNLLNVSDEYLRKNFDPNNDYSLPYMWGTTLIAYRSDKIDQPEKTWKSLWNKKYENKVMIIDDRVEGLGISMLSESLPINSSVSEHIELASNQIVGAIENIGLRVGSDAEVRAGLLSGDVFIASCYSGDAAMIAEENEDIKFFIPEEGAPLWMDNFSIASDSTNVSGAHQFIDYMLRKDSAAKNANFTWYGTTNSGALALIDKELLEDENINPPEEVRSLCQFYYISDNRDVLLNKAWIKVLNALKAKIPEPVDVEVASGSDDFID